MDMKQTPKSRTATCRDCERRLLTKDMHKDGLGSYFCSPCYAAAVALAATLAR